MKLNEKILAVKPRYISKNGKLTYIRIGFDSNGDAVFVSIKHKQKQIEPQKPTKPIKVNGFHLKLFDNTMYFYNNNSHNFDLEGLISTSLADEFQPAEKIVPKPIEKPKKVEGYWTLWGGTRRYPKPVGEQKFIGTLIGNWIHLPDGTRKKADGNHIYYKIID